MAEAAGARRRGGLDGHGGGAGKLTWMPSSQLGSPTIRANTNAASFHALDDPKPDDKMEPWRLSRLVDYLGTAVHHTAARTGSLALSWLPSSTPR